MEDYSNEMSTFTDFINEEIKVKRKMLTSRKAPVSSTGTKIKFYREENKTNVGEEG